MANFCINSRLERDVNIIVRMQAPLYDLGRLPQMTFPRASLLVLAGLTLVACPSRSSTPMTGSGGTSGVGGSRASGDGGSTMSVTCYIDCFSQPFCEGGVIYDLGIGHTAPCDASCPQRVIGSCPNGCGSRLLAFQTCRQELCKENAPKYVGDRCATDQDCRPTVVVRSFTTIENTYLACDPVALTCVSRQPPAAVADWLAPCTPELVASHPVSAQQTEQWFDDPKCSSGTCVVAFSECARQGCSQPCRTDDECPPGSACSLYGCDRFDPAAGRSKAPRERD